MKAAELEKKLGKKKHKTTSELKQVMLVRPDQNPNFCLFLGAGASRSSGIRTASQMVDEWRVIAYKGLRNDTQERSVQDMQRWLKEHHSEWYNEKREYSSLIEHIYPTPANRRKFIEAEVANNIPSIGYAYLVRIAEANLLRTLFTTNFDDLLNEAFYQFSSERAIVCAHDSSVHQIGITTHRTKIIKLHGDYLFDDMKNTTMEVQNLDANMKQKLGEFLKEYGLIIAGYSGSDKSITRILEDMLSNPIYLKNGLFWCFREEDEISDEALEILNYPTDDELIKGVCHSLLEQDGDAIKLFRTEAEKRFSKIDQCIRWPVIARHEKELISIRGELLKAKRGLNDLPTQSGSG